MAEDSPANINPKSPKYLAQLPNIGSKDFENTTGLSTTVPVWYKTAEFVIINAMVIIKPAITLKLVSKYDSSRCSSLSHLSALDTEWNTKLIPIKVVPIRATVLTKAPSGTVGINPLNISTTSGFTIIPVIPNINPIATTNIFIIISINAGVLNTIARNEIVPTMTAATPVGKPVISASPEVAPIKFPDSNPKAVSPITKAINPMIKTLQPSFPGTRSILASIIFFLPIIAILEAIFITIIRDIPENIMVHNKAYPNSTPAFAVLVIVPGPTKALVITAAGPAALTFSKNVFFLSILSSFL